jgi:hypothetical protein
VIAIEGEVGTTWPPTPPAPSICRERLRQILHGHRITFQRTRTWKESSDPNKEVKLDRIEYVTGHFPERCFAFDQFGPISIRPCHGAAWAPQRRPDRLPATYHRTHGTYPCTTSIRTILSPLGDR